MAKRSRRNKKKKTRRALRTIARVALWAAVLAALVASGWVGAVSLWNAVSQRPEFRLNLHGLTLSGCPEWVDCERMGAQLSRQLRALPADISLFEGDIAHAVQHELCACAWVLDVTQVRRELPDRLAVKAHFRRPAAVALCRGERYMVDRDGYWLPAELFSAPRQWDDRNWPVLVDRFLELPPPVGRPWNSPRMEVGARLCNFLRGRGLFNQLRIATIDVSGVGRRTNEPEITLTTAEGTTIKWGQSSSYEQIEALQPDPWMLTDAEKLEMLLSKLSDYPGLRGVEHLDLRYHGKIYRRPSEPSR